MIVMRIKKVARGYVKETVLCDALFAKKISVPSNPYCVKRCCKCFRFCNSWRFLSDACVTRYVLIWCKLLHLLLHPIICSKSYMNTVFIIYGYFVRRFTVSLSCFCEIQT